MKFIATDNLSSSYSLSEALFRCVTPSGGMLMPARQAVLPRAFFNNMREMSLQEIAYVVLNTFFGEDIDSATLKRIAYDALNFDMPLVRIDDDTFALEMFHGPTLAYKDLSARLLARIIGVLNHDTSRPLNVLTSTTGNTGAAIAAGIAKVPGVRVYVLFPKGTLTTLQEAMIASHGPNVRAIEVAGSVDDCRRMVSQAFANRELTETMRLTAANSINVGRILLQTIPFFLLHTELLRKGIDPSAALVGVPCGNLGNLTAAVIAKRTGLPMGRILAACNANDYLHRMATQGSEPEVLPIRHTISKAMDTSRPSNIDRLRHLYPDLRAMKADITTASVPDDLTASTINDVIARTGYVLDPHSAVAYAAMRQALPPGSKGVVLATAHPAKSLDTMTAVTGRAIELPLQLTRYMNGRRSGIILPPTFPALRKYLLRDA